MQLDWTTFFLEALNFLVLVWILKRILYRPVLAVLDARQQRVQAEMAHAEQLQQEAAALKQQYETRLDDWSKEREDARLQLEQELAKRRGAGMESIRQALADEEDKARARDAARAASHEAELVRQAAGEAYGNASAMLLRLASPQLTASIVGILQEDLAALPDAEHEALRKAGKMLGEQATVQIDSAHALDAPVVTNLAQALSVAAGKPLKVVVNLAPELIAGVRVVVGECILHANLAEELDFFKRQGGHAG